MVAVLTAMFFCGFSQNGNGGYNDSSVIIKNGKFGFINKSGKSTTPVEYTSILAYSVSYGRECGATRGSFVVTTLEIPPFFEGSYSEFLNSVSSDYGCMFYYSPIPGWVKKNGKWGFVTRNGKIILPFKYDLICGSETMDTPAEFKMVSKDDTCESSLIVHQENGKWGVVAFDGEIIPHKYDEITGISETTSFEQGEQGEEGETLSNMFSVNQNGKWGIIHSDGKQILPFKYDEIRPIGHTNYEYTFDNAFFVNQNGQWGVVAKQEQTVENSENKEIWKQILPCKYDTSEIVYKNGHFLHKLNGKWGVISSYGEEILPCKYDDIRTFPCVGESTASSEFMVKENNKWGVLSAETASNNKVSLEQTIPCEYDDITTLEDFVAGAGPDCGIGHLDFAVKQNGKWGIINSDDEEILPCKYDNLKKAYIAGPELIWCNKHVNCHVIVQQNNKWGIINPAGKQIIPCKYDEIITPNDHFDISGYYPEQTIFKIKLNGKWGAITVQLNEEDYEIYWDNKNHIWADVICKQILPCKYDEIKQTKNDEWYYNSFLVKQNGKWGVINSDGEEILPCKYDTSEIVYKKGYLYHRLNGKWDVVNSEGKQILPCEYDEIKPVEYKYGNSLDFANSFKVKQNGKWGVVNSEGKQILPCKYEKSEIKCEKFYDQLLLQAKDKFGIMNSEGELLLPCEYDEITAITEIDDYYYGEKLSCVFVKLNGKWGIVNSEGEILLPCEYDSIAKFSSRHIIIKKSSHYGLLTSEFKIYLPCEYQQITALDKGYLMLVKNGKYGIMTDNGNTVLKCEFDSISTTNGNILMKQNGKWGVLNGKGAIPCKYVKIVPAGNFYAVKDGNVWGLVGAAGNTIMKPTYKLENVEALGGFLKVTQKRRCGLLDGNGKLLLPIAYEEITVRDGSSFFVKQKGKWGVADHKGTIVVPCKHVSKSEISR